MEDPPEQMEPVDLSVKSTLKPSRLCHSKSSSLESEMKDAEERSGSGFVLKIPAYQSPLQNFTRLTQNLGLKGGKRTLRNEGVKSIIKIKITAIR